VQRKLFIASHFALRIRIAVDLCVQRNSSLRKLNILGNYINEEVLRAIERLLQTQQSIFEVPRADAMPLRSLYGCRSHSAKK
jgi:hypothetical protein